MFNETSIDQDKVAFSASVRWFILDSLPLVHYDNNKDTRE